MGRMFVFAVILALAGCAGMSKDECLHADWRAVGHEDGARGATMAAFSPRRQACADKAGVTADLDAYLAGRRAGLAEFCRPASGFDHGARGGGYAGVCGDHREPEFLAAYQKGAHLHALSSNAARAFHAVREAQNEVARLRARADDVQRRLVAVETPHAERLTLVLELKQLTEDQQRAEHAVAVLIDDHQRAVAELDAYRRRLAQDGASSPVRSAARY